MSWRVVICLTIAFLGATLPLQAQETCAPNERCLSTPKARKCLKAIEAGHLNLLEQNRTLEAKLNQKNGAIFELRKQYKQEKAHTDKQSATIGSMQTKLNNRPKPPTPYITAAIAAPVGAGIALIIKALASN